MKRLLRCFEWGVLLLVPIFIGIGCVGSEDSPNPRPNSTLLAQSVTHLTSMSAPTTGRGTTVAQRQEFGLPSLYQEDFTDSTGGWPNELLFDNYYVGYHEPDYYHVEVHESNDHTVVPLSDSSLADLTDTTVETKVLVSEANTSPTGDFRYGLVVRRSGNRYYAFIVSPRARSWWVLKSSPAGLEVLSEGADDTIQGLGALDTLRVDAKGSEFRFHINHRIVSEVNDPDFANGQVGFFVETLDVPQAHIHYDSLVIREVASALPSPRPPQ